MISPEIINSIKEQFPDIHPLLFHRTVERAENAAHLYTLLLEVPTEFPIIWNEERYVWEHDPDIFLSSRFKVD